MYQKNARTQLGQEVGPHYSKKHDYRNVQWLGTLRMMTLFVTKTTAVLHCRHAFSANSIVPDMP